MFPARVELTSEHQITVHLCSHCYMIFILFIIETSSKTLNNQTLGRTESGQNIAESTERHYYLNASLHVMAVTLPVVVLAGVHHCPGSDKTGTALCCLPGNHISKHHQLSVLRLFSCSATSSICQLFPLTQTSPHLP